MIKKIYSAVVLFSLVVPGVAVAAEENKAEIQGTVDLGVQGVNINGDKARFQEFRDMDDAVWGNVQLDYLKNAYHFQFDALKPGQEDQAFELKGGEYGNFKYKFNYDEMPHNYTFDAITPYTGLGTPKINVVADPANTSTWTRFDYAVKHKTYGGELELSHNSPFYIKVGADRNEQSGLRPYSLNSTAKEVPEPISNTTNNLHLKGGYLGESFSLSLTGSLSSFENANKFFQLGDTPGIDDNFVLAPDNDYRKLAADLSWRNLPLGSVLAAGVSQANLKNNFTAADINFNGAMLSALPNLNRTTFDGDIDYTNAAIALASRPLDKLDSKIYYRYLEKKNKSSLIFSDDGANTGTLASYQKNDTGLDLGYRLPQHTKLEGGYEYLKMDRSTPEGVGNPTNSTTDNSVYVGLKNSTLDWMTAKVRYKHLNRNSDAMTIATTPFYYQDQARDEWKLSFDLYPAERFDLGLSFAYKNINYDASPDTIQNDKRKNIYLDATWRANTMATFTGFAGYETTKNNANRLPTTDAALTTPQTNTPFSQTNDDVFWTYGLGAKVAASEKLTFNLAWQYQRSDGQVDFSFPSFPANTDSDDYRKNTLEAKASYAIAPKWGMTVGYLYEKLEYSDINFANYTNVVGANYYSGVYANPNYEANIGYLMLSYGL